MVSHTRNSKTVSNFYFDLSEIIFLKYVHMHNVFRYYDVGVVNALRFDRNLKISERACGAGELHDRS